MVFDFICGDEVYGGCTILRRWLERIGRPCILRVKKTHMSDFGSIGRFTCEKGGEGVRTGPLARAGLLGRDGHEGEWAYVWYWFDTAGPGHTLLVRRHRPGGELAFHYCCTSPGQQVALRTWSAPPGSAGRSKKRSRPPKTSDSTNPQARAYTAIRRYTTLVCTALAITAVAAARLRSRTDRRARPGDCGQIALTVPENRRLWAAEHQLVHT